MTPELVLAAHGSRDPRFADTARRVHAEVATALPGVAVTLAYLDLDEPRVDRVLAAAGDRPVVVPLLLAAGYHSRIDLPAIIAGANPSALQTPVIGTHSLTAGLADRLAEAGTDARDGILMCAVGSSEPTADRHVRRRAIELSTILHRPVEVVFATRLGEQNRALVAAVRRLHKAGAARVVLSPYFLSAGLLTERVERALDDLCPDSLVAGPLGTHPTVIDAVTARYLGAVRRLPTGSPA